MSVSNIHLMSAEEAAQALAIDAGISPPIKEEIKEEPKKKEYKKQ